ncbi:MAG: hypothetical protein C5B57_10280, partial [Blastocatellia bacterium]
MQRVLAKTSTEVLREPGGRRARIPYDAAVNVGARMLSPQRDDGSTASVPARAWPLVFLGTLTAAGITSTPSGYISSGRTVATFQLPGIRYGETTRGLGNGTPAAAYNRSILPSVVHDVVRRSVGARSSSSVMTLTLPAIGTGESSKLSTRFTSKVESPRPAVLLNESGIDPMRGRGGKGAELSRRESAEHPFGIEQPSSETTSHLSEIFAGNFVRAGRSPDPAQPNEMLPTRTSPAQLTDGDSTESRFTTGSPLYGEPPASDSSVSPSDARLILKGGSEFRTVVSSSISAGYAGRVVGLMSKGDGPASAARLAFDGGSMVSRLSWKPRPFHRSPDRIAADIPASASSWSLVTSLPRSTWIPQLGNERLAAHHVLSRSALTIGPRQFPGVTIRSAFDSRAGASPANRWSRPFAVLPEYVDGAPNRPSGEMLWSLVDAPMLTGVQRRHVSPIVDTRPELSRSNAIMRVATLTHSPSTHRGATVDSVPSPGIFAVPSDNPVGSAQEVSDVVASPSEMSASPLTFQSAQATTSSSRDRSPAIAADFSAPLVRLMAHATSFRAGSSPLLFPKLLSGPGRSAASSGARMDRAQAQARRIPDGAIGDGTRDFLQPILSRNPPVAGNADVMPTSPHRDLVGPQSSAVGSVSGVASHAVPIIATAVSTWTIRRMEALRDATDSVQRMQRNALAPPIAWPGHAANQRPANGHLFVFRKHVAPAEVSTRNAQIATAPSLETRAADVVSGERQAAPEPAATAGSASSPQAAAA